jgi:hypothetical protein
MPDLEQIYLGIIEIKDDVKYIKEKLDEHDKTLYGNGQPGIKERVIKLETFKAVVLFVVTPIAAVMLSAIGYGFISTLKASGG